MAISRGDRETAGPPASAARRRVESAFAHRFGGPPELLVRAPGRINLVGAHVDTSEGWVLPGAIDRAVWLAARRHRGPQPPAVVALDLNREAAVDPAALPPPVDERAAGAAATWIDYPRGVAWALGGAGSPPPALDAVFGGDLPIGSGVSSSAAVEVAFLLAWSALAPTPLDGAALARLGRRVENEYLGVASGVMDQYASIHGEAGRLLLLDCRTLEHRAIPLPPDLAVLVADSGVRRTLAGSGYGDRAAETGRALAALRRQLPAARTLRDVTAADLERCGGDLAPPLARRARHVVEECSRVLAAAAALEAGDVAAVGRLIDASHASSRDLYEVSTPELDCLAGAASATPGCHGARLSGGGFGGCVTALVDAAAAAAVGRAVGDVFAARFGRRPPSFVCSIAGGAHCWAL